MININEFHFANEVTVADLIELLDALEHMSDSIFSLHCNEEKNDIYTWINENISPEIARKIKHVKTREDMVEKLKSTL